MYEDCINIMLYKCIPFSKEYWPYIFKENQIRFATIPELWNGNDEKEFKHQWDSDFYFFKKYGQNLRSSYESLLKKQLFLA
jgi:hypothetical protein